MNKELIYSYIRHYILQLYNGGIKIKIGDLLIWLNNHYSHLMTHPYGNLRSVIRAAWKRGTYEEQDALEWCLFK